MPIQFLMREPRPVRLSQALGPLSVGEGAAFELFKGKLASEPMPPPWLCELGTGLDGGLIIGPVGEPPACQGPH